MDRLSLSPPGRFAFSHCVANLSAISLSFWNAEALFAGCPVRIRSAFSIENWMRSAAISISERGLFGGEGGWAAMASLIFSSWRDADSRAEDETWSSSLGIESGGAKSVLLRRVALWISGPRDSCMVPNSMSVWSFKELWGSPVDAMISSIFSA